MGKLGYATVQLLSGLSGLSLWFNPISEREQEDSGGKDSRCFVVSWNVAHPSLHSSCSFNPYAFLCIVRSIAGSPPWRDGCTAVALQKARCWSTNPAVFSFHSINIRFSPSYYQYIVSHFYL